MSPVPANVNYTFSAAQIEQLKAYGSIQVHDDGALLTEEGQTDQDFLVTLSGETHIFITTLDGRSCRTALSRSMTLSAWWGR